MIKKVAAAITLAILAAVVAVLFGLWQVQQSIGGIVGEIMATVISLTALCIFFAWPPVYQLVYSYLLPKNDVEK